MPCNQDDRLRIGAHVKMSHQLKTGHARHAHIGNDAIEFFLAIESLQKFRCGHEAKGSNLMSSQVVTQGVKHSRIIVNQRQTNLLSHARTSLLPLMGSVPMPLANLRRAIIGHHGLPRWSRCREAKPVDDEFVEVRVVESGGLLPRIQSRTGSFLFLPAK